MNGDKGGSWSMVRTENGKTLKVQGKGRVEFTDDDSDVKSMEPGGRFYIRDRERLVLRVHRVAIRGDRGKRRLHRTHLHHQREDRQRG